MMLRACWRLAVAVVFIGVALGQSTDSAGFGPLLLSSNPFSGSASVSQILSYDPLSGGFLGVFAAGTDLSQAQGIAYGPDGNLYVASGSTGKILKFDGRTGAALPDFASVTEPLGLAFGPDKNLYVVTNQPDGVRKFSGIDGHSMGSATGIPEGALKSAFAIAFGPDGNLYVTGTLSGTVVRIDSGTLAFMPPVFATLPASGAGGLLFVPNAQTGVTDLLVSDLFHGAIYRLDSNTGQMIGTFASGGALADPGAMALGPNNQIYVSNPFVPNILRYDAATGDLVDIFISPSPYGPGSVNFLTFAPPLTPPTISSNGIVNGIVNAASYAGGTVAPGELLTLFGRGMGPATATPLQIDPKTGRISAYTAGTRVLFNGTPAPVIYTQQYQVSVAVPYNVAGLARVQVQVEYLGQLSQPVTINVSDAMPGIFTAAANGQGQGAIINADGLTANSASAPAAKGQIVSIYATGGGQTNPAGVDGQLTPNSSPLPMLPVSVSIGGIPAKVQYAGGSPGEILGLLQINAIVPPNAPSGDGVPVYVTVGNATSQPGVTMSIR